MKLTRRQFVAASAMAPLAVTGKAGSVKDSVEAQARPFDPGSVHLIDRALAELTERNREFLAGAGNRPAAAHIPANCRAADFGGAAGRLGKAERRIARPFHRPFPIGVRADGGGHRRHHLRGKGNLKSRNWRSARRRNGNGYLSAFPPSFFDRLKAGQKVWAPWYTIHKIMAGLLDMYVWRATNKRSMWCRGMADWTKQWTDRAQRRRAMARVLNVEFGGMNEVLYNLYGITGAKEYAETAHRFDQERIFGPLAEGRDELKGLHVNTQIPKIIGAARRYELTGDPRYRRIAEFFWTQVTQHRAYATGGTSNDEHWRSDPDKLASQLGYSTEECCCTYNMLKLTRHLFGWSPEARYFDYYERALFNGILGTMNPKDGLTMYYVPLASGYWKVFASPRGSFWCCTGTGVESFSKLADSIYFHDKDGVYVNLFVSSDLDWEEKGLRIRQESGLASRHETRVRC